MSRYWRCRRVSAGKPCGELNLASKRKCHRCGKPKPPKRRPKHMAVLDHPYEWWVEQFGEVCGICGAKPKPGKRLYKEHEHKGEGDRCARGLTCFQCNRKLGNKTEQWLLDAAAYLARHRERTAVRVCAYCGREQGHSPRCSVTKFGAPEFLAAQEREEAA